MLCEIRLVQIKTLSKQDPMLFTLTASPKFGVKDVGVSTTSKSKDHLRISMNPSKF